MSYIRGAAAAKAEAIQRRKEAVLAEAMRAEAELDALLKNEQDLQRAERRREKALTDLRQVRDKFTAAAEAAEADVTEMIELRAQIARDAKKAAAAAERIKRELVRAEAADKIIQISRPRIELPPPIYGGPEGLRAAADEADRHGITTHKRPKAA